jgi:two-component system sensor histidine kinase/response regulator
LIIQDRGCGISPENIDKLFIDFNKMEESALLNKNGVGLGLSICKSLIEQMCGKVDVKSELVKY